VTWFPNILASVGEPDLSTTVFGQKIDMPLFLSPGCNAKTFSP
jgi:L-lactate dehydrogenase (cytochrome)